MRTRARLYLSRKFRISCFSGKRLYKIFDPSNGGIGTRLKTIRAKFTITIDTKISNICELTTRPLLRARPKIRASTRFDAGPASATMSSPHRLLDKLYGLYGTGFAYPKTTGDPLLISRNGRKTEPNQLRCTRGLRESLPALYAVLSPSLYAAYPCATSWITTEIIRIITERIAKLVVIESILHHNHDQIHLQSLLSMLISKDLNIAYV